MYTASRRERQIAILQKTEDFTVWVYEKEEIESNHKEQTSMNELIYRIIFTALWVVFIVNLTWVRYSQRQPKSKQQPTQQAKKEQLWHTIALALFGFFWFGGIILYILAPNIIAFLSIPIPDLLRIAMVVVTAFSIPFVVWSYRTIGKNWVHALEPSQFMQKKDDKLVTTGPYKYVRNPIYTGSFTFILALALVASNLLILIPAIAVIVLIYTQIGNEEHMLLERFGDEYREYMKSTPRLIPKLRKS